MKLIATVLVLAASTQSASAFVVAPPSNGAMTRTSPLQMGLFDFFSAEAKKEREDRKNREIEEQEKLQKEIMERRNNPAKMEEYEAKVRVRRQLRMNGNDEAAETVKFYED